MQNTPGPGGYLLAWAVSVVAYAALFAGGTLVADGTGLGTALGVFVIYGYFIGAFSIPFALVGVAIVHLACRHVRSQAIHVVAAALVGLIPAVTFIALWREQIAFVFALVPVATAIGRWSVVPLVQSGRRNEVSRVAPAAS